MTTQKQISRNKKVIKRLQNQLKEGTKVDKEDGSMINLVERDIDRIKKELEILQTRI